MSAQSPDFSNVDVEDIHAEVEQEQAEQERELSEGAKLAEKISKSRAQKTIHVRIEGKRVPFEPIGGRMDDVEDMMGEFAGRDDPEDLSKEEFERYQAMRSKVDSILEEKCKCVDRRSGAFTAMWWKQNFSGEERQKTLGKLARGGIEGSDADGFREK